MPNEPSDVYDVVLSDRSLNALRRLDRRVSKRLLDKLQWMAENMDAVHHTALTGEWRGLFRLRVGDYRVIHALDHEARANCVALLGTRRDICGARAMIMVPHASNG